MDHLSSKQPESYYQLVRHSLRLYRRGIKNCLVISLLLSLFVFLPQFTFFFFGEAMRIEPFTLRGQSELILIHLLALFLFISISWHMHCVLEEKKEPLLQDLYQGATKMWAVFIANCIINFLLLALIISFLVFQIGLDRYVYLFTEKNWLMFSTSLFYLLIQTFIYIYFFTVFSFLLPLIAVENNGILHALKKSVVLTWNHWWRIFSAQATPWLYYFFTLIILRYILNLIFPIDFNTLILRENILQFVLFTFFIPWIAAMQLVQLNDLELRKKI